MKVPLAVALTGILAGAVYVYSASPDAMPNEIVLIAGQPVQDVDQCLRVYGKKVSSDFQRTSGGADVGGGSSRRFPESPGATYVSKESEIRLVLRPIQDRYELVVRSAKPLRSDELAVFRWCAEQGSRIPSSWKLVTGSES